MDRLFPVLSQRHTRTNLPDISTFPEASTQLTHVLVCVRARARSCVWSLVCVRAPLAGFPVPPAFPTPAQSAWLRVRSHLLIQDPLLGFTRKGPGKTVGLSFPNDKALVSV
uniref:Uncharacterized protein n=1 Tax=Rhinolophus ferrumequinum TaxID=59479 RepID=A0A671EKG7_RHIFE